MPLAEQKTLDHPYQSSESSDHGLISHICTTCREQGESAKSVDKPQPPQPICLNCQCHKVEEVAENSSQRKLDDQDRIEVSPQPPALPPRPPPTRPRYDGTAGYGPRNLSSPSGGVRKYVFWCCACGGLATILGALFLAVYFLLRTYTSTLGYFETIPTFVPATMLILTGVCVISLARRKNRYSYLIKICGICCLVCALTCVLVTITTTVIHMNRLQTLRECVYTQKTRTCTCYSVLLESQSTTNDEGVRYIFDSTPDCEVIHGALYTCLRAMFGLSVSGILVCIFSCMLVYQLLSHEKKKMYWEQLELRCRSFYQQPAAPSSTQGSVRGTAPSSTTYCSCCEECRYSSVGPQVYPWEAPHPAERFWTPGRVGNFYSPNPEDLPPQSGVLDVARGRPGWSWRRLPWTRTNEPNQYHQGSADSQYGFSNRDSNAASTESYSMLDNRPPPIGGVYVWGPPPPYSDPNSPARRAIQSPSRYHHYHRHQQHCHMKNYENTPTTTTTVEPEIHHHHLQEGSESTDTSSSCVHSLQVRKKKRSTNEENDYNEPEKPQSEATTCRFLPRLQGVENAAFQKSEQPQAESEVYFADVSSCCNISVHGLYDEATDPRSKKSDEARSRLPFAPEEFPKLPMDISQQSLSSIQTPMTETTDDTLSPDDDQYLAPDAQYEIIPDPDTFSSNLTTTISTVSYDGFYNQNSYSPKSRRTIGHNISALIQNLNSSSGAIYGTPEIGGGTCPSDGTIDSGWQSEADKQEVSCDSKSVNV